MSDILHITTTTFFKKHPTPVANLKATDWERANVGEDVPVKLLGGSDGHYKVSRDGGEWYIFSGHCTFIPSGGNYLALRKTRGTDSYGAIVLDLQYFRDCEMSDEIHVCSGQPNKQYFRKGVDSISGSGEPLPEGIWYVGDVVWAGGKDNYAGGVIAEGIGPVTVPLTYIYPDCTQRSAIEVHIDWNRGNRYPGTIGCVGFYSIENYKKFISWLRETDPRYLFVDWELGTIATPK